MSKIIIIFCEGSHDVAFVSKILKTACYKTYHSVKIKEYPHPLGNMFEGSLKNIPFGDLKIDELSTKAIPNKILEKNEQDKIVLLYALGGNRQYDRSKKIIDLFLDIKQDATTRGNESGNEIGLIGEDTKHEISFVFINDADNDLNSEIKKVQDFMNATYGESLSLVHNSYTTFKLSMKIGVFIFSKDGVKGTLEDYLMETMKQDNEAIFDDATTFYQTYFVDSKLIRKKILCKDTEVIEKNDKTQKEYKNKSIITIAGQLQNSGVSQAVTIEYSDYLNLDKMQKSAKIQEIITFIENA